MIKTVSEADAGMEIFNQFVFADSLTESEKVDMIQSAMELGRDYAKQIEREYGKRRAKEFLKALGIEIVPENDRQGANRDYVKFAEYYAKSSQVRLNMAAIEKLSGKIRPELAEDIILCHELYHYFETSRWGLTSARFVRTVKMFGMIPVKRKMFPAAEIAANSFTRAYLGLDFHPQVIEALYFEEG